ncbi:DUF2875 family protein [Achromobacter sp. NPDC058515]|uniref:type VI lipase adapter Tla3 domain-containing protein n=1 Tax=Achromobacter sp. NPDC058515 TaxID=3346533 RepID=UPI003662BDA0
MIHYFRSSSLTFGLALVSLPGFATSANELTPNSCLSSAITPFTSDALAKEASTMSIDARYRAPTTSPRLDFLDVVSAGLIVDVYRQGQVWDALQTQDAVQSNALHATSILPTDPKKYPVTADAKDMAYDKRKADALELGLRNFLEKWPIPTVMVVRGWNPHAPNLRIPADRIDRMLSTMVNRLRGPAGLHWHHIRQLEDGIVCNDTPEGVMENLFQLFEKNPDLPAVLVYSIDGFNMALALTTKGNKPIGVGTGPRQPGELTDAMVAMVVGRPERVNWLREYARYTKPNKNPINPEFTGWARTPKVPFTPSPFLPQPWTARAFEQWDALPVLARLHRPVTVSLQDSAGKRLKNDALTAAQSAAWRQATQGLPTQPARVFYDNGKPDNTVLAEWAPSLQAAGSSVDLLASNQSYNLTQRLGDTGAASPFVGIALATMASYLNADASVVAPLRRGDQATLITVSSPTPGNKPRFNSFGVKLMPQTSSSDWPDPRFLASLEQPKQSAVTPARYIDPEQVARDKNALDDFIASGPGVDLFDPKMK